MILLKMESLSKLKLLLLKPLKPLALLHKLCQAQLLLDRLQWQLQREQLPKLQEQC